MAVAHSHRLKRADLCLTYNNSAATYACHELGEKTLGSTRGVDFAECVGNYQRICGSSLKRVNWGILQMASCLLGSRQPGHGTHTQQPRVHSPVPLLASECVSLFLALHSSLNKGQGLAYIRCQNLYFCKKKWSTNAETYFAENLRCRRRILCSTFRLQFSLFDFK